MITDIVKSLTAEENETLHKKIAGSNSPLYQFIGVMLNEPEISKEAVEKKFGINENTYFKNLSLAKNEIYEVIRHHMTTAYDELMLPNILYKRGLEVHASKLRLKLEEDYEKQGWWLALNELYAHELGVAYAKCDLPWMKKVKEKTISNARRLTDYLILDKELVYLMAVLEKGNVKDAEIAGMEKKIGGFIKDAERIGHVVLIFNSFYCLLQLYTTIDVNRDKAQKIVDQIALFLKKYEGKTFAYVERVAILNLLNFYANFESDKKPGTFFKAVNDGLGKHGMLYDAQVLLNFCSYYFLQRDRENFEKQLQQLLATPSDRSFGYQHSYAQALHAYMAHDSKAFFTFQNEFYSEDDSREYNGYNLMLRYLEILLLIKEESFALASDKSEALNKFLRRNFSKSRIEAEKQNLQLLRAAIQHSRPSKLKERAFRITGFLEEELV